jgi:hypothetical protein
LSSESVGKFGSLCSGSNDASYFREEILKPILQVRVSGTEGNARVRQVCIMSVLLKMQRRYISAIAALNIVLLFVRSYDHLKRICYTSTCRR